MHNKRANQARSHTANLSDRLVEGFEAEELQAIWLHRRGVVGCIKFDLGDAWLLG